MSHDYETRDERELGMDAELLKIVRLKCDGFMIFLHHARVMGPYSDKTRKALALMEEGFSELYQQTGIALLADMAGDVEMPVRVVPKIAMLGASERLDADDLKYGSAAE